MAQLRKRLTPVQVARGEALAAALREKRHYDQPGN
jgi:hypothetical protein